jgi:hypothetical protein
MWQAATPWDSMNDDGTLQDLEPHGGNLAPGSPDNNP